MYENPTEQNENFFWKPEIKYAYKMKNGLRKIEGIEINFTSGFTGYNLIDKIQLEKIQSIDFLCLTLLYKFDNQHFGSNFCENPFKDVFEIRNKKDNFRKIGELQWNNEIRKFEGIESKDLPKMTTCIIGIDSTGCEIEIDLSPAVSMDLLKKKTKGTKEINPKAVFMFDNTAIKLTPSLLTAELDTLGEVKFLEPSKGALKVEDYKENLDDLSVKLKKMLQSKAIIPVLEDNQDFDSDEIPF